MVKTIELVNWHYEKRTQQLCGEVLINEVTLVYVLQKFDNVRYLGFSTEQQHHVYHHAATQTRIRCHVTQEALLF